MHIYNAPKRFQHSLFNGGLRGQVRPWDSRRSDNPLNNKQDDQHNRRAKVKSSERRQCPANRSQQRFRNLENGLIQTKQQRVWAGSAHRNNERKD